MLHDITIGEIFNHQPKEGDVGIEIEMEAHNVLPMVNSVYWNTVKEGSLRNGVEFVSKVPFTLDTKSKHLASLFKKIEEAAAKPVKDSHRTSIHTHNNVTSFTPVQTWTAITAYYLVENILFSEYFGEERVGNHFCLRLKDADYIINDYANNLKGYKPFSDFDPETHKYAALNVAPIRERGSLELRGMKGLVDPVSIDIWTTASPLLFKKAINKWKSPSDLLDDYYHNDWKYIVSTLFDNPVKNILLSCKNGEDLMEENVIRVLGYSFMVPWASYQKQVNSAYRDKPKKKKSSYEEALDGLARVEVVQPRLDRMWFDDVIAVNPIPRPLKKKVRVANNPPPIPDNLERGF